MPPQPVSFGTCTLSDFWPGSRAKRKQNRKNSLNCVRSSVFACSIGNTLVSFASESHLWMDGDCGHAKTWMGWAYPSTAMPRSHSSSVNSPTAEMTHRGIRLLFPKQAALTEACRIHCPGKYVKANLPIKQPM